MTNKKRLFECHLCGHPTYRNDKPRKIGHFCDSCHPNFARKGKRIALVCQNCQKPFYVQPYRTFRKFCSQKCYGQMVVPRRNQLAAKYSTVLTKEALYDLYWNQKMSVQDIGKKFNILRTTVLLAFRRFSIPRRSVSEGVRLAYQQKPEFRTLVAHKGEKNSMYGRIAYPKAKFIKELGHPVRSRWEYEVACLLRLHGIPYKYESTAFKLDGGQLTYTPDFLTGPIALEVKGPLFPKNIEKLKLFRKEHPEYKLVLLTLKGQRYDYKSLADHVFPLYKGANYAKHGRHDVMDREVTYEFIQWLKANLHQGN